MAWFALAILGISLDLFQAANDIIPLGGAPRLVEYVIFSCLLYTSPSPRDRG